MTEEKQGGTTPEPEAIASATDQASEDTVAAVAVADEPATSTDDAAATTETESAPAAEAVADEPASEPAAASASPDAVTADAATGDIDDAATGDTADTAATFPPPPPQAADATAETADAVGAIQLTTALPRPRRSRPLLALLAEGASNKEIGAGSAFPFTRPSSMSAPCWTSSTPWAAPTQSPMRRGGAYSTSEVRL